MNRQDIVNIISIIESQKQTEDNQLIKRLLVELIEKDEKEIDEYFNSLEYKHEEYEHNASLYCSDDVPF